MQALNLALICGLLPAAAAFAVAAWLGRRERRGAFSSAARPAGGALGLSLAYVAAHLGSFGLSGPRPIHSWEWFLYAMPAAALLGAAGGAARRTTVRLLAGLAASGLAGWLLVPSWLEPLTGWRVGMAAGVFLVAVAAGRAAEAAPSPVWPLTWGLTSVAAAALLVLSANARLGQLAAAMAAGLAGLTFAALLRPRSAFGAPAALVAATGLLGLLVQGYASNYGEVPPSAFLLVGGAPLAGCLARQAVRSGRERLGPRGGAAVIAGVLLVLALAAWLSWPANEAAGRTNGW